MAVQVIIEQLNTVSFLSKIPITWELFISCKESPVKAEEEFCGRGGYAGKRIVCVCLALILCAMVFSASILLLLSPVVNARDQAPGRVAAKPAKQVCKIAQLSTKAFINSVAWSPNGKYLAALSYYGTTITVWDTQTWEKVNEFPRNGGFYCDSSFGFLTNDSVVTTAPLGPSPDPKYIELARFFNVEAWDIHTGKFLRCLPEEPLHNPDSRYSPRMDTFSVSSNHGLIAGVESGIYRNTVSVLDAKSGRQLFSRVIPIEWGVDLSESKSLKSEGTHTLAFSQDGKRLAVGTGYEQGTKQNKTLAGGGHVYILDSRTGKILKSFWAYHWKPDNYRDQPDADGFITWRPQDIYEVRRIIFSPDGRWIVTAKEKIFDPRSGNRVAATIFNARTGAKVTDIQGKVIRDLGKDEVIRINAMAWSGNWLAMGDGSGAVRVYAVKNPRKPLLMYNDDPDAGGLSTRATIYSMSLSQNGLVAYSRDNQIHIMLFPAI